MNDFFENSAKKFTDCVKGYIKAAEPEKDIEERFWELVKSIRFSGDSISPECELFKCMKDYADKNPIDKVSLIWEMNFEKIQSIVLKPILVEIFEKKESGIKHFLRNECEF